MPTTTKHRGKTKTKLFKREKDMIVDMIDVCKHVALVGESEKRADAKAAADALEKFSGHFKEEATT